MSRPDRAPGTLNLRGGSALPELPGQRVEQIFRVAGSGAPGAVAVANDTTVRILLQDAACDLESDPRAYLRFCSDILTYAARRIVSHRIHVVGPDATSGVAQGVMVELAREFPNLHRHLVLCVTTVSRANGSLSPTARQLLSQITQKPLPTSEAPEESSAAGDRPVEAKEPITTLGPELREALSAIPQAEEPIDAYGEITRLITPLPSKGSAVTRLAAYLRDRLSEALNLWSEAPGR